MNTYKVVVTRADGSAVTYTQQAPNLYILMENFAQILVDAEDIHATKIS